MQPQDRPRELLCLNGEGVFPHLGIGTVTTQSEYRVFPTTKT